MNAFRNLLKIFLVLSAILFVSITVQAIGTSAPSIKKGASVEIRSWDPQVQAVELKLVNETAVGPNFADINDFIKALGLTGENATRMKRNPSSKKGVVLNLKTELELLDYDDLKSRLPKDLQKKIKKKEARGRAKAKKAAKKKSK